MIYYTGVKERNFSFLESAFYVECASLRLVRGLQLQPLEALMSIQTDRDF